MVYIRIVKYLGFDEYHSFEYVIGGGTLRNILLFSGEKSNVPIGKTIEVSTTFNKKHLYCLVDDELYIRKKQHQTEQQMLEKLSKHYDKIVSSMDNQPCCNYEDGWQDDWNVDVQDYQLEEHQQILDRLDLIYSRTVP